MGQAQMGQAGPEASGRILPRADRLPNHRRGDSPNDDDGLHAQPRADAGRQFFHKRFAI